MRVRKVLALTLAMVLVLGSFTFALGAGLGYIDDGVLDDYTKFTGSTNDDVGTGKYWAKDESSGTSATIPLGNGYEVNFSYRLTDGERMEVKYNLIEDDTTLTDKYEIQVDFLILKAGSGYNIHNDTNEDTYYMVDGQNEISHVVIAYTFTEIQPTYDITVTKTADPTTAKVGDTITYSITVTNDSSVELTDILVEDSMFGTLDTDLTLASGGSTSYGMTMAAVVEGTMTNIVTASSVEGMVSDTAQADVEVTAEPPDTGILTIEKEVWIDEVQESDNDTIFTFTVNGETVTASAVMDGQIELPVGTYVVEETGYGMFTPETVTQQAVVTTEGETVTFVNTYTTPDETGTLTINKRVLIGDSVDENNTTVFTFEITQNDELYATITASAITPGQIQLPFGSYKVSEVSMENWQILTSWKGFDLEGEDPTAEFTFDNAFIDDGTYSITVNKDVIGTATDTEFEVAIYPWMDQIIPMDEFYGPVRIDLPLLDEGNGAPPPYATTGTIIEGDPFVVNGLEPGDYWVSENPEIEGFYTPPDQLVGIDNENVEVTITNYQYPEIEIVKTVDDSSVRVNEDVTYTITVTNLGGFYLPEVVVEDEQLDFVTTTSLDIGESESFEIETSYSSTGDKVNTATASAVVAVIEGEGELYSMHPDELPITHQLPVLDIFELEVSDSATVNVSRTSTRSTYRMTIDKVADGDFYEVGDTIEYTITVENTGNSTLTNVLVTDDMTGLSETIDFLSPGETEEFETTYVAQQADVGDLTNTATAEDDRAGNEEATEIVTVEDIPEGVPGTYELEIEKTAVVEGDIFSGDMVEFAIVVTNTGDEILENILVEDDMVDFEAVIDELEPGESEEFTVMVEAPNVPGPFTNTATATSTETGTQQADDTVFVEEPIPLDVPDTGVAPTDLFFGLGALVSGLGVFFTKKRK